MDINLGEYLRVMRGNKSLAEIAEKSGISVSYLSDLERGRTLPSIDTLEKLARAYGMTLAIRFMDGNGEPHGYQMVRSDKWQALMRAFSALDVDE